MITTIEDLKNRTLVESNNLKSLILSSLNGEFGYSPNRDDILIHDYQIANSVTINSILSNFIANLNYAWNIVDDRNSQATNSYFQIVTEVSEIESLDSKVNMFLFVKDGVGSFYKNGIDYQVSEIENDKGTIKFINLSAQWYGIIINQVVHNFENDNGVDLGHKNTNGVEDIQYESEYEKVISWNEISLVASMNDNTKNPNPYGMNPFDAQLICDFLGEKPTIEPSTGYAYGSFNKWMRQQAFNDESNSVNINCITDNLFYNSTVFNSIDSGFVNILPKCKYLVCTTYGLYGLEPIFNGSTFSEKMVIYNLGEMIKSLIDPEKFEFTYCQSSVVNETTLFIIFKERTSGIYYYTYINESDYDQVYGITGINLLANDKFLVEPNKVFSSLESIQDFDSLTIAMTDYGFWAIENNETSDVVYSYRGVKSFIDQLTTYKELASKVLLPTAGYGNTDIICEYDRKWIKNSSKNTYSCGGKTYPFEIAPESDAYKNTYIGGAYDGYGVYNSSNNGSSPAYLLLKMTQDRFHELLFSVPELLNIFMRKFWYSVVDETQGEKYLKDNHSRFVTKLNTIATSFNFSDIEYSESDKSLILSGKTKMQDLIKDKASSTERTRMPLYCKWFKEKVSESVTNANAITTWLNGWLMSGKSIDLISNIATSFVSKYNSEILANNVSSIVDDLINNFNQLQYFKQYLTAHLTNDLTLETIDNSKIELNKDTVANIIRNVLTNLKSAMQTALILGGYDDSKTGNLKYPGIDVYVQQDRVKLERTNVSSILSGTNIVKEVQKSIQATKFFSEYNTFDSMKIGGKNDTNLFKLEQNIDMVSESGLVTDNKLNIDWSRISSWLLDDSIQTDETMLHEFIKTQIYRPMFFNYYTMNKSGYDYDNFTETPLMYKCQTSRSYENEDGQINPLVLNEDDSVDIEKSRLNTILTDGNQKYGNIEFSKITNRLSYEIYHEPITIVDDKFVYDDIEYYCVRSGTYTSNQNRVTSIYFNEFQLHQQENTGKIQIDSNNKFTLGGVEYTLVNDTLSKSQFSEVFGENKEFRGEVSDNRFTLNGVQYIIQQEGDSKFIVFDNLDETKLVRYEMTYLAGVGSCQYYHQDDSLDLRLEFRVVDGDDNTITVVKFHRTPVINNLSNEWCVFDDINVKIDSNHTWDWYFGNEILRIGKLNSSYYPMLKQFSNILFNGWLDTSCIVQFYHEVTNQTIVTKARAVKTIDGTQEFRDFGVIYGTTMELSSDKLLIGLINETTGLVVPHGTPSDGSIAYIVKDTSIGATNTNTVAIPYSVWNSRLVIKDVGKLVTEVEEGTDSDGNSTTITNVFVEFTDSSDYENPTSVQIIPTDDASKYIIRLDFTVDNDVIYRKVNNTLSFIANGYRYCITFTDDTHGQVMRFDSTDMEATIFDFKAMYDADTLRNKLLDGIRQYMMTTIVQDIVDNGDLTTIRFNDSSDKFDKYLDMFSDNESTSNYLTLNSSEDDYKVNKFKEIFKNNLKDIDQTNVYLGKIYIKFNDILNEFFDGSDFKYLVNKPSINVTRTSNVDTYSYKVLFDLSMKVNKNIIKEYIQAHSNDNVEGFILGGVTIKGIECSVNIVPLSYDSSALKYDVTYQISLLSSKPITIEYDRIIYAYDGKVRTRNIDTVSKSVSIAKTITHSKSNQAWVDVIKEHVQTEIEFIITQSTVRDLFVQINNAVSIDPITLTYSLSKNGDDKSIFEFGETPPSNALSGQTNYGKAVIDGIVFSVDSTSTKLQATGQRDFDIVSLRSHNSEWASDFTTAETNDWNADLSTCYAPLGYTQDNLSNDFLTSTFQFGVSGQDKYMYYSGFKFKPSCSDISLNSTNYMIIDDPLGKSGASSGVLIGGNLIENSSFRIDFTPDEVTLGYATRTLMLSANNSQYFVDSTWFGQQGTVDIQFTNLNTESPTITMGSSTICYEYSPMFNGASYQEPSGDFVGEIKIYSPTGVQICEDDIQQFDSSYEDGADEGYDEDGGEEEEPVGREGEGEGAEPEEDSTEPETKTLYVQVIADVSQRLFATKPSSSSPYYNYQYSLYVKSSEVFHVFNVSDIDGYSVGSLPYGIVSIPFNIGQVSLVDDLKWYTIYVELNSSGTAITSDGRYCPFKLVVIPPNDYPTEPYHIYDRYYLIENKLQSTHRTDILTGTSANNQFWMEKTPTIKSIRNSLTITTTEYNQLIEANVIPQNLRDSIKNMIYNATLLDDSQFTQTISSIQSFISNIDDELKQDIDKDALVSICNFKYDVKGIAFAAHSATTDAWNNVTSGLFGYDRNGDAYKKCRDQFNDALYNEFIVDFIGLNPTSYVSGTTYDDILKSSYSATTENGRKNKLLSFRNILISGIYNNIGKFQTNESQNATYDIDSIFANGTYGGSPSHARTIKYINAIPTSITSTIDKVFVADNLCHIFTRNGDSITWYKMSSDFSFADRLLKLKCENAGNYQYSMTPTYLTYGIDGSITNYFRFINRDLTSKNTSENSKISENDITDAYSIRTTDEDNHQLWYVSYINKYIYSPTEIKDMAYEQTYDSLYVIFVGDNHLYRYDNLSKNTNESMKIQILKETATKKIVTYHAVAITPSNFDNTLNSIYLDYEVDSQKDQIKWTIRLYGTWKNKSNGTIHNTEECWIGSPGSGVQHFLQYNTVIFGDNVFNESQLNFQNISKNKSMYDIIDINEVDGCFYGLFLDRNKTSQRTDGTEIYTIFKTSVIEKDANGKSISNGVISRLPYDIVCPKIFKTADPLYSLYVVVEDSNGKKILQEITTPNSDMYKERVIELQSLLERQVDAKAYLGFDVNDILINEFVFDDKNSTFFSLTNYGFHKIGYKTVQKQLSIDTIEQFTELEVESLRNSIFDNHMSEYHNDDYFTTIDSKMNQFADDFSTFQIIPTEFTQTQDIGVIPSGVVDDTDESTDHRNDSVIVSTDILYTDGLVVDKDNNPGFITCAVSNPATMYDDDTIFMKTQRNPSIEGTEFYDYIYDQDGNVLMDLYQVSYLYRINSNNTYDLYINVPTTRTKYLNRIAGSLTDDLTSQVKPDDTRTRLNFLDEQMANNLDESTTKLRVYIDKKFISIGNVELVEISGNSIPLGIYRDTANNGQYDSLALEGRWTGELTQINQPEKDINKVMLEFEVYGTDSQSIHISGKTLIHFQLDDAKYQFG